MLGVYEATFGLSSPDLSGDLSIVNKDVIKILQWLILKLDQKSALCAFFYIIERTMYSNIKDRSEKINRIRDNIKSFLDNNCYDIIYCHPIDSCYDKLILWPKNSLRNKYYENAKNFDLFDYLLPTSMSRLIDIKFLKLVGDKYELYYKPEQFVEHVYSKTVEDKKLDSKELDTEYDSCKNLTQKIIECKNLKESMVTELIKKLTSLIDVVKKI